MKTRKRLTLVDKTMNEPVHMCGFPQIIVTRDFMYQWLKGCGYSPSERGFGSLDYIVFASPKAEGELSDPEWRDKMLANVRDGYLRGGMAA